MKNKKELRKEVLGARQSLSTDDVIEKSMVITNKLSESSGTAEKICAP